MSTNDVQYDAYEQMHAPLLKDPIAESLRSYAEHILVAVFGLLPVLFIPSGVAPFEYTKILFVSVAVLCALIFYSLAALRTGGITLGISPVIIASWGVAGVALISALFSNDFSDAFIGDTFATHTNAFLTLLALVVSLWTLIAVEKRAVMRLYMLLATSTVVLVVYHTTRIFLSPEVLSFGVFNGMMSTPVGSWNDLALFLGLSIILSLVALDQLSLTRQGKALFVAVILFALGMLGVINFFTVWVVLGCTSLALVVYALSKDRMPQSQPTLVGIRSINMSSLVGSFVVFLVSAIFIIGGSALGGVITNLTGISYVEVRPSFEATVDIASAVYEEHAFLGTGPNKFTDAWREYKDASINGTVFWNTDFIAGNGYITTFFVTTGILGGLAWLIFLGLLIRSGLRMVFQGSEKDRLWYFIGISSFVSALYIWGMSFVYVPGAVMLLLAGLCTGLTVVSERALGTAPSRVFSCTTNRRTGFIFTFGVVVIIIGSVSILYSVGKHYASVYAYVEAAQASTAGDRDTYRQGLEKAYTLFPNDVYNRRIAELELGRINELLALPAPTETERALFEQSIVTGIDAAKRAVATDPSDSENWTVLGNLYSALIGANIEGIYDEASKALDEAITLNPQNPLMYLNRAILDGRAGRNDTARSFALQAVSLKSNYTDAYYYLSQVDILTGNVAGAIESTRSTILLDPQNPARYYQLGVLQVSQEEYENAITSFEKSVALDPNFSNARYFLAIAYAEVGRTADARTQLDQLLLLNPGNEEVMQMIASLQSGTEINSAPVFSNEQPLGSGDSEMNDTTVTSDGDPESDLVSPINTVPTTPTIE